MIKSGTLRYRNRRVFLTVSSRSFHFPGLLYRTRCLLCTCFCIIMAAIVQSRAAGKNESDTNQSTSASTIYDDLSLAELFNLKVTIASLTETELSKVPASVTIINREQIEMTPARYLFDLLEIYVPNSMFCLHMTHRYGIRGILSDRNYKLLLLLNGKVVNDHAWDGAGTLLRNWDLSSVERIEIVRGPGSVTYGPGAIAGIINVITKSAGFHNAGELGWTFGSISNLSYHSNGGFIEFKNDFGPVALYANASICQTDGRVDTWFGNPNKTPIVGFEDETFHLDSDYLRYASLPRSIIKGRAATDADAVRPQMKVDIDMKLFETYRFRAHYSNSSSYWEWAGNGQLKFQWDEEQWPDRTFERQLLVSELSYKNHITSFLLVDAAISYDRKDYWQTIYPSGISDSTLLPNPNAGYRTFASSDPRYGNVQLDFAEHNLGGKVNGTVTLFEQYTGVFGGEAYSLMYRNSPMQGNTKDDLGDGVGPVFEIPQTPVQPKGKSTAQPPQTWMPEDGYNSWYGALLGEINLPFHPMVQVIVSGRADFNKLTTPALSPRLAYVAEINKRNIIKMIGQRSVRINMFPELWMTSLNGEKTDVFERLETAELVYKTIPLDSWNVSMNIHYNQVEALGWRLYSANSASNANQGMTEKICESATIGFELESELDFKKVKAGFSHSYEKLTDFEASLSANKNKQQGISYADYLSSALMGNDTIMTFSSYGMNLNNWSNHQTRLWATAQLPFNFTLHGDMQVFWAYDGYQDGQQMYLNAINNADDDDLALVGVTKEQLRTIEAEFRDAGFGATNIGFNIGVKYKVPCDKTAAEIYAYAGQLLSNKRYGMAPYYNHWFIWRQNFRIEKPAFGFKIKVGF